MFFCLWIALSMAFASEEMQKGDVLKEDSLVFTKEEAERLKARIIELESKERELGNSNWHNIYEYETT